MQPRSQPAPASRRRLARLLPLASACVPALLPAQDPEPPVPVATDAFDILFSTAGGVPVEWRLRRSGGRREVLLLDFDVALRAEFAPLAVVLGDDPAGDRRPHELVREREGDLERLRFTSPVGPNGLQVTKIYELRQEGYRLDLRVEIANRGSERVAVGGAASGPGLTLGPGIGLAPGRLPVPPENAWLSWAEAFVRTSEGLVAAPVPDAEPFRTELPREGSGIAWGGVHSQHLAMVVVPAGSGGGELPFARATVIGPTIVVGEPLSGGDLLFYPELILRHRAVSLAPGQSWSRSYTVYAGPKDHERLADVAPGLDDIVFHHLPGWLAAIAIALRAVLGFLYGFLDDWGLSIVVFAVLFRVVTLPLSLHGARSQMLMRVKMAALKPQLAAIKREHKSGDARNKAILALYKEHGINPLSNMQGCLPLLVQLPILIGLFQLLLNSPELQGTGFLWIGDLTQPDRLFPLPVTLPWLGSSFNLLPMIMLGAQIAITRSITRATASSGSSSRAIYLLPVAMTLLFWPFPAGCMLFWTTGNVLQVLEQRASAAHVRSTLAARAA